MLVKISAKKAGEVGLNITEEDLIISYKVEDVLDVKVPAISAGLSLNELIKVVADTNSYCYPVVDNAGKLTGIITLDGIMNTFSTQELNDWLVALDLAEPVIEKVVPQMPLSEAFEKAKEMDVEFLPAVAPDDKDKYVGILNIRSAHRRLAAEVLAKQKEADSMYSHGHS
jgi:CIC family chloride channel protein